ncbi:hypothetical protein [Vibrio sp. D406a]|uniref:hypothetical protein n=1 Tax=Vibrio sp. D406a TaxID=2836435 RepID=UPI0025574CE2|nr:hypothetical protein [Vibrio sp. D406a]MDK9805949.1 hypothetical protein [Vibrio sp. D406a]
MKSLSLFLCLVLLPFTTSALESAAIDLLTKPTLLLNQGRYRQAAQSFHQQANLALSKELQLGSEQMWQVAGLADGLASISAERAEDPVAYEYWSNSIRYFLMGGSDWQTLQQQLHQEVEQANTSLKSNLSPDSGYQVDSNWLALLALVEVWEEKLGFLSFTSPKVGLLKERQATLQESSRSPQQASVQLRQYTPDGQLNINSGFESKSTFVMEPKPQANPERIVIQKPNEHEIIKEGSELTVVEAFPLDEVTQSLESDYSGEHKEENIAQEAVKQISRGNVELQDTQPVEAIQRRTFTPVND